MNKTSEKGLTYTVSTKDEIHKIKNKAYQNKYTI